MEESGKIEYFEEGEYNTVAYDPCSLNIPAFCNGELVDGFPDIQSFRSKHIVKYNIGYLDLYINIITSGVLIKAYGFEIMNINYTDDIDRLRFSCVLNYKKTSLGALDISNDGEIRYINNTLAYIKNSLDKFTYVVNNGVKYIAIGSFKNSFTLVVPPSVEDIRFVKYDDINNKRYNILVSKEKYSLLVDKLYDSIGAYDELGGIGGNSLDEKIELINEFNIEVSTYG